MWCIPPMQHQCVPVRVAEEGHMADARVEDVSLELDACALEPRTRARHICNSQRDVRGVRRGELLADVGRVDQIEADVVSELVLRPAAPADEGQAKPLAVEAHRALLVRDGDGDEVSALNRDHASLLSRGAYR